jgi:tubulin epsilon
MKDSKPFDAMNGLAANAVLQLTSSVRFAGPLNTDLNEIAMNLVPFPRMHFLLSSMAPLVPPADGAAPAVRRSAVGGGAAAAGAGAASCVPARLVDSLFGDSLTRDTQLLSCDPKRSTCLAAALLLRGNVALSDVRRNAVRMQSTLRMAWWNTEGFKIGLCGAPPPGLPCSLFTLANSCAVGTTFGTMHERFSKLRQRSVYLHHYSQYMSVGDMDEAAHRIATLADEYAQLDTRAAQPESVLVERFSSLGLGGSGAPRA